MTVSFAERIALLHEALREAAIPHGFGGAVALAYYVLEPRATRDIDINISMPPDRAVTVLEALPRGVEVGKEAAETVARDGQVRLWWNGGSPIPLDLFFPQHDFHAEVARDTHVVPFLDGTIPIISATHLAIFKSLFNRSRDWPDIEAMLQAGTVDTGVALAWVERLVGPDSASYGRLSDLVGRLRAGGPTGSAAHPEPPVVDWRSLGSDQG